MQKIKKLSAILISIIVIIAIALTCTVICCFKQTRNDNANAIVGSGKGWSNSDTANGIYYIKSTSDFSSFKTAVSGGNKFSGCTVYLTASISLSSHTAVGVDTTNYFAGTFDGQGFNINITNTSNTATYWGIFGYAKNCIIKNLHATSVDMVYNSSTTTTKYAGFVLGYGDGNTTIQNCEAVITRLYAGSGYSSMHIGGIVGYINGVANITNNKITLTYTSGNGYSIRAYGDVKVSNGSVTSGGIVGYMNITGKSTFDNNTVISNTGGIYSYGSRYSSSYSYLIGGTGTMAGVVLSSNSKYINIKNSTSVVKYRIYIDGTSTQYVGGVVGYIKNVSIQNSIVDISDNGYLLNGIVQQTEGTCNIFNNKVNVGSSGIINAEFCGIVKMTFGTTQVYGCSVNFNVQNCIINSSVNGIVGTNVGVLDIYKCIVNVNAVKAINYTTSSTMNFYGILNRVGRSSSNDKGVNMTTTISNCILNVTQINGIYCYAGIIAGISGICQSGTDYGNASLTISGCYVGGGGSISIVDYNSSSSYIICGIAYDNINKVIVKNCMNELTLNCSSSGSRNSVFGISNTALVSNCIVTGTMSSYAVTPIGVNATNSIAYCKYSHTINVTNADGTTTTARETVTLHDVEASELSDRNYLGTLGFDLEKWRSIDNSGISLILGILLDYDDRLTPTKFEYNLSKETIDFTIKANGYQVALTNGNENVSLATTNSGTIGLATYSAQVSDGFIKVSIKDFIMSNYSFYVVNNVTTSSPYVSVFKTNYTGQEQGFTYEISAVYAGGYYPKVSINNSAFVEIADKELNEQVLGGCYYSCQFALGVFNMQVSGIGASNIVLDAYAHSKDTPTTGTITTSVTGGSANIKITYDDNNGAEMLVTPSSGFYVSALIFGDCTVPVEYYEAQILNAGSAKKIVYYAKESTNIFFISFDRIYANMNINVLLTTGKPTLKNPPTSSGGAKIYGTVVSASEGGEAKIVGNSIADSENENATVTFVAVAYAGYEFLAWVNGNDETEILSTAASIKLPKSTVNGKIVKALFVPKSDSNLTNSNIDDNGESGLM